MIFLGELITYSRPDLFVEYDYVAVMDGLSDFDRKRYRIKDRLSEVFKKESLCLKCFEVSSKESLVLYLLILFIKSREGKKFIIHFVSHGNEEGVRMGSYFAYWIMLGPLLEKINSAMQCDLIVNMSTCKGLHGIKMVKPLGGYPFFGLIGAKKDLKVSDAISANSLFYKYVSNGVPIQKAIPKINEDLENEVLFNVSSEGFRRLKNT